MDGDLHNYLQISIEQLMQAWQNDLYGITKLIFAFSYLAGVVTIFRAFYYLKIYGEARTMMSSNSSAAAPTAMILFGACLLFLPSAIDVFSFTFYNQPASALAYSNVQDDLYKNLMAIIRLFVQVIGFIAVVRGFIILSGLAGKQGSSPPGTFGKGVIHVIGGILLINFWTTAAVFSKFFGVSWE